MERIILDYSSFLLFGGFNGGNRSTFSYLGVKMGGNEISRREYSFLSLFTKSQIFIPSKNSPIDLAIYFKTGVY